MTSEPHAQNQTYILRPDVVATVMVDGAVLLDLRTKYFYSANRTAWAILCSLEAGADLEALSRSCAERTQDTASVAAFFSFVKAEDLVEATQSPAWDGQLAATGEWIQPVLEKHKEPLQRIMMSAFDPSVPLAE